MPGSPLLIRTSWGCSAAQQGSTLRRVKLQGLDELPRGAAVLGVEVPWTATAGSRP